MFNVFIGTKSRFIGRKIPKECIEISEENFAELLEDKLIWEGDHLVPNPNWKQIVAEREAEQAENERLIKIANLKSQLAQYDYIGIKIAMGVATREDYASEIAITEGLRQQIRALESK